jgi:SAM-dependent methyltransferase
MAHLEGPAGMWEAGMTTTEHDDDYGAAVRAAVLDEETFLRLTASGKARGAGAPWVKVVVRPVLVRERTRMQFSYFDGKKDTTKNFVGAMVGEKLDELLAMGFSQFHVQSTTGDLHVRITKKGRALVRRAKPSRREREPVLTHDRRKPYPIPADGHDSFLQAIGIMGQSGRVRAAMQGKFRQINEFVRLMEQMLPPEGLEKQALEIVDCGCGNAYLTFAAYHYLNDIKDIPAHVVGVDSNEEIIAKCRDLSESLGWEAVEFRVSRIREYRPETRPDLVLSLHACDTATDEAIAQGIRWGSRFILAAPCCQHELHDTLRAPLFRPVLRHGILKERTADILTDAFRALVLRIMGYRTDVVQFVDPEHTAKNLMIRARKGLKPGGKAHVGEYERLKEFWGVEPCIEGLLGEEIGPYLRRGEGDAV